MTLRVAVLGLGEAGSLIAADLVRAGVRVRGFDPITERSAAGIERLSSAAEAALGADVILSLNWARASLEAAASVMPVLHPETLYADLNTSSPNRKREVAALIEATGAAFADVALLNPVPGNGLRTPTLASGSGAARFVEVFGALGMPTETVEGGVGAASARKLARSVFYKGLAACVGEALEAARELGCEDWLRENIGLTLQGMNTKTVDRLLEGSRLHAVRRREEMLAAAQMLQDLGLEPRLAQATADWLEALHKANRRDV